MSDKILLKYSLAKFKMCLTAIRMLRTARVSMGLGYALNKTQEAIVDVLKPSDDTLKELAKEHDATFNANGSGFSIPDERLDEFNKKAQEFMEAEVEEIEVRPIVLPPDCEVDSAAEILGVLGDFVSVRGMEEPEPKSKLVHPVTGNPMSDGEAAQLAVVKQE